MHKSSRLLCRVYSIKLTAVVAMQDKISRMCEVNSIETRSAARSGRGPCRQKVDKHQDGKTVQYAAEPPDEPLHEQQQRHGQQHQGENGSVKGHGSVYVNSRLSSESVMIHTAASAKKNAR